MSDVPKLAYTPTELAKALGCTRQHVQNLVGDGRIPSVRLGRKRLIAAAWVDELLSGGTDLDRCVAAIEQAAADLTCDHADRLRAVLTEAEAGLVVA